MRVVGGDERDLHLLRELGEAGEHLRALGVDVGLVVLHHFEIEVVEDIREEAGKFLCLVLAILTEQLVHLAGRAAAEGDDALAVFGEQLLVHARLVVEAFEVRLGAELDEVAVAGLVLRQQRQVVIVVGARIGLLVARVGRDVGLDADDRLDAAGARFLIEVDSAVEGAVVGHGDRLLADREDAIHHIGDATEPVEKRELGVEVQVREHMFGLARMIANHDLECDGCRCQVAAATNSLRGSRSCAQKMIMS